MFGHLYTAEHVKLTLVLSLSITALIIRCVAVGTPEGYSLYSLNSTDVLDPVYKSGEFKINTFENHFERNVDNNHSPIDALFPPRRARCVHR